jgi:nucleotide-binding universal stress UspA family protein
VQQKDGEVILLSVPHLQHALVEDKAGYGFLLPHQSLENSRHELEAYLADLELTRSHPETTLRSLVVWGDAASVIVDTAVAEDVDLIVMSTHGRSGFSRWMLGSVTERVLRHAPCPVLVIREAKPLTHILITLDGSVLSEYALGPGMEVASRWGSHVTLLSVESSDMLDPAYIADLEKAEIGLGTRTKEDFYHRTEAYLQRMAKRLQEDLEQMVHIAPRTGPVANAILDFIDEGSVDLVVMATHGRSGLRRWVYGSITEKVMHGAHCAMLIVRSPEAALHG